MINKKLPAAVGMLNLSARLTTLKKDILKIKTKTIMKTTFTAFVLTFTIFLSISALNAQTYFSDNFENGLGNWIVGGNNWDTLSTTYTSSNHCATDSRIGNYTYNSDPTITMSPTINLSNSTFPVLTFFHRYILYDDANTGYPRDNINIQVSTNAGLNWTTLQSWQFTNRAWTFVQLDLRNYRTNLVKIRFMLSCHNGMNNTGDGWYIDDAKILEESILNPVSILPFTDNFENGMGKWIKGGFNWDTTSATFNTGLRSATDSRVGNYTYDSDPTLTMTGIVDLSKTVLPALTFFQRYKLYDDANTGYPRDNINIQVSTNGGFSWTTLRSYQFTNLAWTYVDPINLTPYRTNRVKIRFLLSSHNGLSGTDDGWYIDDVSIRDLASGVTQIENSIPDKYSLNQNYPNPFNPVTNIEFSIPKQSNVKITVYDSQGKKVDLLNQRLSAGSYRVDFDGTNFSSGIYFYKLEADNFVETKSMVLLK